MITNCQHLTQPTYQMIFLKHNNIMHILTYRKNGLTLFNFVVLFILWTIIFEQQLKIFKVWIYDCKDNYFCEIFYSIPKVEVSSTANNNFSSNTSGEGYGGKSNLLKQVCALKENNIFDIKVWQLSGSTLNS